jgi:hypothetical protein
MAVLTPNVPPNAVVYANAAVAGDVYLNGSNRFLHVRNGGVAPITVTITAHTACSAGVLHDLTYTVANGADKILGPFDPARFNNTSGQIEVGYSDNTTVTVAAIG